MKKKRLHLRAMKNVLIGFWFFFSFVSLASQEYVIIVKSKSEERTPQKEEIYIPKDSFHYTLDKLLEKENGVLIQKFGGEGSYSLIRIRGSNANQVHLYLDGIPLNFASYSEVDVSDLSLWNYQKIEFQKNGSMTGLVGSSIGGSINLIPNYETERNQVFLHGGSFGTFGGGINYNFAWKDHTQEPKFYLGIAAMSESSKQDYEFLNHNGTIYFNRLDDYKDKQRNAYYRKTSGLITSSFSLGKTQVRILNDSFYRVHGIPGPITRQTEKTKREHFRNTSGIRIVSKGIFWGNFQLDTRWYYTYIKNRFYDPRNELAFSSNNSRAELNNKGVHLIPGWSFIITQNFWYKTQFLLGYEEEYFFENRYSNFNIKTTEIPEKKRYHYSFHFHQQFSFFDEFIEFLPEFRYEEYRNNFLIETRTKQLLTIDEIKKDESKISFVNSLYSLIFNLIKNQNQKWNFFIKYHQEKRIPSFIELFGEKGSIVPNLKLRPEQSYNSEVGSIFQFKNIFLDVRGYYRWVRDLIRFLPNSQFSLRAENIQRARIRGFETTAKYKHDWFQIYLAYQYMQAKRIGTSRSAQEEIYIPLMPLHTFKGGIHLFPENTWEFQIEGIYYGAFFRNESNDYFSYQPRKWIFHFTMIYRYQKQLLAYLEVRNTQNLLYEDIIGYPLPGRSYVLGVKYFFD
ncbi:MAG: TonB-dependent receptor [Leptospiraceae bacterium]|nr:TonB-dependent receptor [Leptospiraceae bacterium]MDW7976779.1 TonB-dependent receptor [Leptospiraceae bacterium]